MKKKQIFYRAGFNYSNLFKIVFTLVSIILLINNQIKAQDKVSVINELDVIHSKEGGGKDNAWIQFNDAPNSLYHYIAGQAYPLLDQRVSFVVGLHSLSDWQKRQEFLRKTLLDIVGPFPEKTPLNAKITRTIEKDSYRVEHIIYESQPGLYVTSSMFIPHGLKKGNKVPCIIFCSGHSDNGYRYLSYQNIILNLVKKGFIVFAFDPVDQGERLEYFDPQTNMPKPGGSDSWHSYSGAQALITGSSQVKYMMWDGIRAVDYVLTRSEVDPARIGITGTSGGGTQSAFIAALDDRIYATAPSCFITNYTRIFQSIGPQDAEQNMFNGILSGLDHGDLLLVRAPKPALILATTEDFFSIQGARETAKEVSNMYKAFGKEDNFSIAQDGGPHGTTPKNREAMYAFFQTSLNNPGNPKEEKVEPLSTEEMQVSKTGQVYTSFRGETIFSLNCKESEKLVAKLQFSRNDLSRHLPEVLESAKKLSGYQNPLVTSEPVFTGRIQRDGYVIYKYFIAGEGNYIIPYLLMVPDKSNNKALIYLHPSGKSAEASVGGEMEWFVRNGFTVLAPDMIGVGEMGPGDFHGDSYIEGVSFNVWFSSMLIGRSIVGIRAGDVVRLTQLLKKNIGISEVYGFARKEMGSVLLYAAAFDPAITRIALIKPYSSYRSIVMSRFYNPAFIYSTVPGALKAFDLPDLEASLAPRKLMMVSVTDASGSTVGIEDINQDLDIIRNAYHFRNVDGQLNIVSPKPNENLCNFFSKWIE
ncbi:hypothetical protein AQPE_4397 [Aquipluma nitroreducens]|uniref:Acetyl xylan esterase domain-containing protein n=2 Tax=Aquipluma nitroreducens TaxID=2010828 RepID=A0A5K7SFG4_9BACT|nr:hypothetical protein AQPE_4397 [Aquipluma nitroreducens]